jgi:fructose-1,6-bisphosphatase class II
MDRNFALEFVRVTEMAAIASARLMGRGDEKAADQAAVDSMRAILDSIEFEGTVVIGEGERDEAPMLFIGEKVGSGNGPKLDIALDPLEGTTVCALGLPNSISVMAIAEEGHFLNAPDTYMEKIAVGPKGKGSVDLKESPGENLGRLAEVRKCRIQDLTAVILNRPRHEEIIDQVRSAGARIHLIGDGDVAAAISCAMPDTGVDILFGTGGAPEGVIAAAALRCIGGEIQGRLRPRNQSEIDRMEKMGITDPNKIYQTGELASGNVMFAATGVTTGKFLQGVRFTSWGARTSSMVMRSSSGTIRHIEADHHFDRKPRY